MTIAVAHQVSPTSPIALQQALTEAKLRGTDLAVFHAVESIDPDQTESYRLGISDAIQKVCAGSDVTWQLHLVVANTADLGGTLVRLADEVGAEILVIGARRRSPVGKALLGSVTQTVILEANVPVLVVKTS